MYWYCKESMPFQHSLAVKLGVTLPISKLYKMQQIRVQEQHQIRTKGHSVWLIEETEGGQRLFVCSKFSMLWQHKQHQKADKTAFLSPYLYKIFFRYLRKSTWLERLFQHRWTREAWSRDWLSLAQEIFLWRLTFITSLLLWFRICTLLWRRYISILWHREHFKNYTN